MGFVVPASAGLGLLKAGTTATFRAHPMVFCDGHVEAWKIEKLFFEETEETLRRWNYDHDPRLDRLLAARNRRN